MSTKYSLAREINTKVDTIVKSIMEEAKKEGKREGKREGKLEGKLECKLEGKLESYKEMAIRLLKQGYDIAAIANITGLSRTEIESLRNGC